MPLRRLSFAITRFFAVDGLAMLPAIACATPNEQWLPAAQSGPDVSGCGAVRLRSPLETLLACVVMLIAIAAAPAPVRAEPVLLNSLGDARHISATWIDYTQAFGHAAVQRRYDLGPWGDRDSIIADADGRFVVGEQPLHLGRVTAIRLSYADSSGVHATQAVSDTVPAFQAAGYFLPHSDGATVGWYVTPNAAGFHAYVQSAPTRQGPWSTVLIFPGSQGGWFEYRDALRPPQSGWAYRLIFGDGFDEFSSAPESVTTLTPPLLVSVQINPTQAWLDWKVPTDAHGFAYTLTLDTLVYAYAGIGPDFDDHLRFSVTFPSYPDFEVADPALPETAFVRLRWQEPDDSVHEGAWLKLLPPTARVDSIGCESHAHEVRTRWHIAPGDSTYVVRLYRAEDAVVPRYADYGQFVATLRGDAGVVEFDDKTVLPGRWYGYQVQYTSHGQGYFVEIRSGWTPPDPQATYAIPRPDGIRLVWFLDHGVGFSATLQRRQDGGAWADVRAVVASGDTLMAVDTNVQEGHTYGYRLQWIDGADTLMTGVGETLLPVSSATLISADVRPHRVKTHWHALTFDPLFRWYLQRSEMGTARWDTLGVLADDGAGERVFTDTTAIGGHTYRYRVAWTRAAGPAYSAEYPLRVGGGALALSAPYPNPTRDALHVQFVVPDPTSATVALFDLNGRMRESALYQGPGQFEWSIPRGAVEPGLYFIQLRSGGRTRERRIAVLP